MIVNLGFLELNWNQTTLQKNFVLKTEKCKGEFGGRSEEVHTHTWLYNTEQCGMY